MQERGGEECWACSLPTAHHACLHAQKARGPKQITCSGKAGRQKKVVGRCVAGRQVVKGVCSMPCSTSVLPVLSVCGKWRAMPMPCSEMREGGGAVVAVYTYMAVFFQAPMPQAHVMERGSMPCLRGREKREQRYFSCFFPSQPSREREKMIAIIGQAFSGAGERGKKR